MKLTELIEKRIDENVASYDLGTLESYKYLIEMIAIEYHKEQLRLYSVVVPKGAFNCGKERAFGEERCKAQCKDCVIEYQDN